MTTPDNPPANEPTVLDELTRLNKNITDAEQSLLLAERYRALFPHKVTLNDVTECRVKVIRAHEEWSVFERFLTERNRRAEA